MDESAGRKGKVGPVYRMCIHAYTCLLIYSTSVAVLDACYERLKEDVRSFRKKGDFNTGRGVGIAADDDDVIGKFGKDICNAI